jgi:putative ABC transport system permease protein
MTADAPAALREQMVANFSPAELHMTPRQAHDFAQAIAARAAADGRVQNVSLSVTGGIRFGSVDAPKTNDRPATMVNATASWFDVMNVKVLAGRRLTDADDASTAVMSAAAADLVTPGASPLGRVIRVDDGSGIAQQLRIVGVVEDSRTRPTTERPAPVIYGPFPAAVAGAFTLRVRSTSPDGLRADLQTIINQVDPRITWTSIRRGDMQFDDDAKEMEVAVYSVGLAGLIGLVLSATGLYAVMSYVVTLRRREIGVRLAIGAPPSQIVVLMLRQSMRLVIIGVVAGLSLGVPMAFGMRALFVAPVNAIDPVAFLPAMTLLVVVGALASIIPALRASRVDPIATLRQD